MITPPLNLIEKLLHRLSKLKTVCKGYDYPVSSSFFFEKTRHNLHSFHSLVLLYVYQTHAGNGEDLEYYNCNFE